MISEIYGFTMNPLESTGLERAYIKLIWKTKPKFFLRSPGRDYYITHVPVYNEFVTSPMIVVISQSLVKSWGSKMEEIVFWVRGIIRE